MPGVTLLGDAAHLASPNGERANLAMVDGAEPALSIAAHSGDVEAALVAYEQAMFVRTAETHGADADDHTLQELIAEIHRAQAEPTPNNAEVRSTHT